MTFSEAKKIKMGDVIEEKHRNLKYIVINSINTGDGILFECYDSQLRRCMHFHRDVKVCPPDKIL